MGKFVINGTTEVNSGVGSAIIGGASFVSKLITNDGMWERGHYFNINDTTVGEIGMYGKGETVYHAFTRVPVQLPQAGCVTIPCCLFTTVTLSSS